MTKAEFIEMLKEQLSGLPQEEIEDSLHFYSEMIDDRIEEGETEENAVLEIGSVDEVASQIITNVPLIKIAKERIKPKRRLKGWEITLLAIGSPIWLSLAIAAFAVVLSLYVVLWSVSISVWAVFVSLAACSVGGVFAGIVFACVGNGFAGVATIGAGVACAGLAIFLFFASKYLAKGIVILTAKIVLGIKKGFIRKER